jgi:holin-like protein
MKGFAILLGFLFLGQFLQYLLIPLPGSVIGLLLLTASLFLGWIKLSWIEEAAQLLLKNMTLFFVPVIVAAMVIFADYSQHLVPIIISLVVGTIAVLLVSGGVVQALLGSKDLATDKQEEAS